MATVRLESVYIGQVGGTGIYRVDLSQSGFGSIGAITIHDDNILSGGTGSHSGADIDFVKIFDVAMWDAASVATTPGQAVFDYTASGVVFDVGQVMPLNPGEPPERNTNLQGTSAGNVYDPDRATFGTVDGRELSLGEGGQVSFLFKSGLSANGRYLYFGDTGGNGEGAYVLVSNLPESPIAQFTLIGTARNDTIRLGIGQNEHLLFTDTTVYGRRGDDKIYGSFGNDTLYGETGADYVSGGWGNDWVYGGTGKDRVYGGSGNDRVNGGSSNDRLSGGGGSDVFVFDSTLGRATNDRKVNFDKITDFNVRYDSFWLDNKIFKKLGKGTSFDPGDLKREFFVTGDKARERDDYLLYNRKTGVLSYDSDGSGKKAAVEFAQLSKGLKLTYHDFFVI